MRSTTFCGVCTYGVSPKSCATAAPASTAAPSSIAPITAMARHRIAAEIAVASETHGTISETILNEVTADERRQTRINYDAPLPELGSSGLPLQAVRPRTGRLSPRE